MEDVTIARLLHVVGVVLWIGGVALVTTVILPEAQSRSDPGARLGLFDAIERRFARQARWTVLVTGLSGLYMAYRLDLWHRFSKAEFWWMHAMVALWLVFSAMIFLLEPLVLHRWFRQQAMAAPDRAFAWAIRLHRLLLLASLLTIAGAVLGSHGLALF